MRLIYACAVLIVATTQALAAQDSSFSLRAVIDKYCVTCHNERLKTAGLMLDKADIDHPGAKAEVWEKVLRKLREKEMPPSGRPRPDPATYTAMSAFLEKALDDAASANPKPGGFPFTG